MGQGENRHCRSMLVPLQGVRPVAVNWRTGGAAPSANKLLFGKILG